MFSKVLRRINIRFFRFYAVIATIFRCVFARNVFARARKGTEIERNYSSRCVIRALVFANLTY
jgi:hypothetical protein